MLITHEVDTLKKRAALAGEMRVKGSALKRSVTAMYQGTYPRPNCIHRALVCLCRHAHTSVDEVGLEITVEMPFNYPLGMVTVDSNTDMGIKSYRKWLLQMTTYLANQVSEPCTP